MKNSLFNSFFSLDNNIELKLCNKDSLIINCLCLLSSVRKNLTISFFVESIKVSISPIENSKKEGIFNFALFLSKEFIAELILLVIKSLTLTCQVSFFKIILLNIILGICL